MQLILKSLSYTLHSNEKITCSNIHPYTTSMLGTIHCLIHIWSTHCFWSHIYSHLWASFCLSAIILEYGLLYTLDKNFKHNHGEMHKPLSQPLDSMDRFHTDMQSDCSVMFRKHYFILQNVKTLKKSANQSQSEAYVYENEDTMNSSVHKLMSEPIILYDRIS
jgi:hypothetical protein